MIAMTTDPHPHHPPGGNDLESVGIRYADLSPELRRKRSEELMANGLSDVQRWSNIENFPAAWDSRARVVAAMIQPPAVVLDLGCGAMALEREFSPGITYIPADLVARDHRTHVFDANAGSFPIVSADVAVALGVLEYLNRPDEFFSAVSARWPRLIVTYHPVDVEGAGRDRRAKGWLTDMTTSEIEGLAVNAGFVLHDMVHFKNQRIFDFRHP